MLTPLQNKLKTQKYKGNPLKTRKNAQHGDANTPPALRLITGKHKNRA
jgi:hypothetical protein